MHIHVRHVRCAAHETRAPPDEVHTRPTAAHFVTQVFGRILGRTSLRSGRHAVH